MLRRPFLAAAAALSTAPLLSRLTAAASPPPPAMTRRTAVDIFTLTSTGTVLANYPSLELRDSIRFDLRYALVGAYLSSTFVLTTGTPSAFAIVANRNLASLGVSETCGAVLSHISVPGVPKTLDTYIRLDGAGIVLDPGAFVSLYAANVSIPNIANAMVATAHIFCAPIL